MALIGIAVLVLIIFGTMIVCQLINRKNERKEQLSKKIQEVEKRNRLITYFIHQLELAETLDDVFVLHIKIWANGLRNPNFGPDSCGMFRTDDILLMDKTEVYLGNIWGLWTKPLPCWEGDLENRATVLKQYKNLLISNLKTMIE